MKIGVIYQMKNLKTGCIYIGSSINFHKRRLEHLSDLKGGFHHSPYLQRSYDKHGVDSFEFSILAKGPEIYLKKLEQWFLDALKPKYNMAKDAIRPSLGRKLTQEQKDKISKLHQNNTHTLGRKSSEETKKKMSLARTGKSTAGQNNDNKKYYPILQYDREGNLVGEYSCITEAVRITGIPRQTISQVCRGKYKYGYGFHWKYKNEPNGVGKKIINLETGDIYDSIKECSKILDIHPNSISNSLNGRCKSHKYLQYLKTHLENELQTIE